MERIGLSPTPELFEELSVRLRKINDKLLLPDPPDCWSKRGELKESDARAHCDSSGSMRAAAFSDCGGKVALGHSDGTLRIYELIQAVFGHNPWSEIDHGAGADERSLHDLYRYHDKGVATLQFSPDGKMVAVGFSDGALKLLCLGESGGQSVCTRSYQVKHNGAVTSLAFSPDGKRLVSGNIYGNIELYDLETLPSGFWKWTLEAFTAGSLRPSGRIRLPNEINSVTFSADGEQIATVHRKGEVFTFPAGVAGDGDPVATARFKLGVSPDMMTRFKSEPFRVAFSPCGTMLAAGGPGCELVVRDLKALRNRVPELLSTIGLTGIRAISFNGDGTLLAVGCGNRAIVLESRLDAGQERGRYQEVASFTAKSHIKHIAFNREGSRLLVVLESGELFLF
jgi:WD40 repeat protein